MRSIGPLAVRLDRVAPAMRILKGLAIAAVGLAVVILGGVIYIDNHSPVALRLLDRESPALPVFVWLYAAFATGAIAGFALCFFGFVRGKLEQRRLQRALRDQGRELDRLRDGADSAQQP